MAARGLPAIAEAGPDQSAAMVASLAAAFADDPAMSWIMPDRADRQARLKRLFAVLVAEELDVGWALSSPNCEAVTLWRTADKVHAGIWDLVRSLPSYFGALGANLPRALKVSLAIEAHHPRALDYDYLHFAGVDPAFQGRGWGGTAIRAGFERAKARGCPVYLETATPENVGLYQRLGFTVTQEWDVAGGGPHFWSMLCDPR